MSKSEITESFTMTKQKHINRKERILLMGENIFGHLIHAHLIQTGRTTFVNYTSLFSQETEGEFMTKSGPINQF